MADGTVFHMKNNAIYWSTATLQIYSLELFPTLTFFSMDLIGKNNYTIACLGSNNLFIFQKDWSAIKLKKRDDLCRSAYVTKC